MSEHDGSQQQPALRYHPVRELCRGAVVGVDVVTTWPGQSPAERRAQLARTDAQLLAQVAADVAEGPAAAAGWWVCVELGLRRLARPAGPERLLDLLHHAGLAPSRLVLSVVEWEVVRLLEADAVAPLAAAGIRFSLTDLGAGHLSPADLRRGAVGQVRIDVGDLGGDPADASLLAAVAAAAQRLGADAVAQHVDGEVQAELVRAAGITLAQGTHWLRARGAAPPWPAAG